MAFYASLSPTIVVFFCPSTLIHPLVILDLVCGLECTGVKSSTFYPMV